MLSSFLNIFKGPSKSELDAYLQKFTPQTFDWMALAVNERTLQDSIMTKELVLISNDGKKQFTWQTAEKEEGPLHLAYREKKCLYKSQITDHQQHDDLKKKFNSLINKMIEQNLTTFREGFSKGTISNRQLENEEKALEWMRVSFEVLSKGIVESLTNRDFLFQSTLFAGTNPKTGKHEIRLICFNLDMTFILLDDFDLRVIIYNKGSAANFDGLKPAMVGDYSARKREILDQLTNLIGVLSKGLHL
jgi:hypothetical protein